MPETLVYTLPEFAKAIRTSKDNVYALCELGVIKPFGFGKRDQKISVYEAERFLKENAGRNFHQVIEEAKERKKLLSTI